jgi:hypothetical protein
VRLGVGSNDGHTYCHSYAPLYGVCLAASQVSQLGLVVNMRKPFSDSGGFLNHRAAVVLAHEIGHFFGICGQHSHAECQSSHTNNHIPDLMVWDGGPALNVRPVEGMFFKFMTTCASVYDTILCATAKALPASCARPLTCANGGISCRPSPPAMPMPPAPPPLPPAWPSPPSEPPASPWVLSARGESCDAACAVDGRLCAVDEIRAVVGDSQAFASANAAAGGACTSITSWGYDSGPGICTSQGCCGGACVGICTMGATSSMSCAASSSSYERLCACEFPSPLPPSPPPPPSQSPSPPPPSPPRSCPTTAMPSTCTVMESQLHMRCSCQYTHWDKFEDMDGKGCARPLVPSLICL